MSRRPPTHPESELQRRVLKERARLAHERKAKEQAARNAAKTKKKT